MVDFVKSAKTAKRLIDKNGRLVKFVNKSKLLADPDKPWGESKTGSTSFAMICVFTDYESKELDGDNIKAGDKKLLANAIDNGTNKIEDFEFVEDGDSTWRIKSVQPLQPGDTIVMYEVQLRK
jgi:hypothetical protein